MAKIQNIVSTFHLGSSLPDSIYFEIARKGINTEYNPRKFHAIVMRIRFCGSPSTTVSALVFRNGKVVQYGARSIDECYKTSLRICRRINFSLNIQEKVDSYKVYNFKICNIVGSLNAPFRLNIERLYKELNNNLILSKKLDFTIFPALRIKLNIPKVSVLIFISGKIVITGLQNTYDLEWTSNLISNLIDNYKR